MQHPDCLQRLRHGNFIHAQKTLDPLNLPQKNWWGDAIVARCATGALLGFTQRPAEAGRCNPPFTGPWMVLRGTWNRTPTDFTVKTSWFLRDFRLDQCIEGHGAGVGDIHGIYVYIYIYDLGMCFQMSKHTIPPNFWRASSGENVGISPWPLNFQVMGRKSQDIFGFDFAN